MMQLHFIKALGFSFLCLAQQVVLGCMIGLNNPQFVFSVFCPIGMVRKSC